MARQCLHCRATFVIIPLPFTNEHKDACNMFNPSEPMRPVMPSGHTALAAYIISPTGEVGKQKLAAKNGHGLFTPLKRYGNSRHTLLTGSSKGIISEIAIKE